MQEPSGQQVGSGSEGRDAARLGAGAGLVLFGMVTGRGLKLLIRVAIARLLGPALLGLYDLGWTISYMLAFVTPWGFPAAAVRYGTPLWRSDTGAMRALAKRLLATVLTSGLVAALILYLSAGAVARRLFGIPELERVLHILAPMIPLAAGLLMLAALTRVTQRMRYTALFRDLLEPALQCALFFLLWHLGLRLDAALWAAVGSFGLAFLTLGIVTHRLFPRAVARQPPPALRTLFGYSLPVALSSMLGAYLIWIDRLMVGFFRSPAELGAYAAAAQLAVLFALLYSAVTMAIAPLLVDLHHRSEKARLESLFRVATRWGLWLLTPLAAVFVAAPSVAVVGIFGDSFAAAALPLVVLTAGQLINIATGPVGQILIMTGNERVWLALSVAAIGVNIVLNVLLLPRMGIVGAAWASATALAVLTVGGVAAVRRRLGLWPYDRRLFKVVAGLGAALAAVAVASRLPIDADPLRLMVVLACSFAAAAVTLLALGPEPEERTLLRELRRRLRSEAVEARGE